VADHLAGPDRGRLSRQDQERRLEGVFGIMQVAQHAPADPHHHRPMAPHQCREGGLIPPEQEALQQLAVSQARAVAEQDGLPEVPDDVVHRARSVGSSPRPHH
jgi:hypothetical protein